MDTVTQPDTVDMPEDFEAKVRFYRLALTAEDRRERAQAERLRRLVWW